jgi:hypothetical protein
LNYLDSILAKEEIREGVVFSLEVELWRCGGNLEFVGGK